MDAAVAGLAKLHSIAVAPTLLAGYQVVARGVLHYPLAETTAAFDSTLRTGSRLGGGLPHLLATQHSKKGK